MPSYLPKATLSLVFLFVSSFVVEAIPVSDTILKRSLSCSDNASNGTIYTTTSHTYEISCGIDYYGSDISSTNTATFEACLSVCDSTAGCVAVSYVSGSCYLKSQVNKPWVNNAVWGAKRVGAPVPQLSCVNNAADGATYSSGQRIYTIHCASDYYGGDLSMVTTSTMEQCIATCDSTSGCIDVSYSGSNCYLKNKLTTLTRNWNVETAVLTSAELSNPSLSSGPTCANNIATPPQYTATSGAVFDILCGVDYYGGDLTSVDTSTFGACIEACDANAQCIDVSYVGTTCYLKSTLNTIYANSAWTAKLRSAKPVSSSTVPISSTTLSKTTASSTTTTTTPSSITTATTTSSTTTISTPSSTTSTTTTTAIATTTTTTTAPSTPTTTTLITTTTTITTSQAPHASNIVVSSWSWAANGYQGGLQGFFTTGSVGYNGSFYGELYESSSYGDSGTRSMCANTWVDVTDAGPYTLTFYIGRIVNLPPGSSYSTVAISYEVKFDGVSYGAGGVCGSYGNTCPLKAADGVNRYAAVTVSGVNGTLGYKQLSVCGTYTSGFRGPGDSMLVSDVQLDGPS